MRGGQNFVDLSGETFGRLKVIQRAPGPGKVRYICQCTCGAQCTVLADSLRKGATTSCGCFRREKMKQTHTKHNGCGEPLYGVLNMMHQRCENPNNKDFIYYGARGIAVCREWRNYDEFRKWASQSGYTPGLTIDRVDPNGNYCPDNCRWITIQEQQRNRRPKSGTKER